MTNYEILKHILNHIYISSSYLLFKLIITISHYCYNLVITQKLFSTVLKQTKAIRKQNDVVP